MLPSAGSVSFVVSSMLTSLISGKIFEYKLPSEWIWYREGLEDKIFREKRTKETFQAGLQYLPFYLQRAMPDEELVAYLEKNTVDPIRAKELPRLAWAEDKTKVEQEAAAFLKVSELSWLVWAVSFMCVCCVDSGVRSARRLLRRRIPLK